MPAGGDGRGRARQRAQGAPRLLGRGGERVEVKVGVQAVDLGQRVLGAAPRARADRGDAEKKPALGQVPLGGERRDVALGPRRDEALAAAPVDLVGAVD